MNSNTDANRSTRSIKELVLEETALASVFEKHAIDFCCGGELSLEEACARKGIDVRRVLIEIEQVRGENHYSALHAELWSPEFLIDYIVQNHHRYCNETIPVLTMRLTTLSEKHGESRPYLKQVLMLFKAAIKDMEQHMRKEEMILFPHIKSISSAKELGSLKPLAPFQTVFGPITHIQNEHEKIAQVFYKIRALLNNYVPPEGACATHKAALTGLEEFEKDLHQHVHLENNLLFPMALTLEQELDDLQRALLRSTRPLRAPLPPQSNA